MSLRFGMIGGSAGSFIGKIHRYGAELDSSAHLCSGCFSRNSEKNAAAAREWNIAADRVYSDYREMADKECLREDRPDFIAIATPNATHFEIAKCFMEKGFNIVCDKPMTVTSEQGRELEKLARAKDLLFAVTYTYSGFPMVHEMRNIVQSGKLGRIMMVSSEYPQGGRMRRLNNGDYKTDWHFDPEISGPGGSSFDIGTHVQYTTEFVTGKKIKRILARMEHTKGSVLDTGASVMVEYEDGTEGMYWLSQAAAGIDNALKIRVFGEFGSVEWCHSDAAFLKLRMIDQPEQVLSVAQPYLCDDAKKLSRLHAGHYEGFIGAFANIYNAFCSALQAKKDGKPYQIGFPTIADGTESVRFVEACLESDSKGNVWVEMN